MSFEIRYRDLAGRIGKIKTKSGIIETPVLLPVINPIKLTIPINKLKKDFKCKALITNAYLLKKNCENDVLVKGVHDFLNFKGVIMTDSGAYQLLVYGDVDISPEEVIKFQEKIGSDIAVFLDIPTGSKVDYKAAELTVNKTLERARESITIRNRKDILWAGPIQGGAFLDLVEKSASEMSKLPFDIYAIGSPTQFLEQYNYEKIVQMVMSAKKHLPMNKPIHLFGAGHPIIFSIAVAMGCDIFDSAAYALYANGDRYLTPYGTKHLEELQEQICLCPICTKYSPYELKQMNKFERTKLLAQHNLYVSLNELNNVKMAIREGRLWEYIEIKSRSHPNLYAAFKELSKYKDELEKGTPSYKKRALLWLSEDSSQRPEIYRHIENLKKLHLPGNPDTLIILPEPEKKPFRNSRLNKRIYRTINKNPDLTSKIQLVTLSKMFGLIPQEIEDIYPLAQHLTPSNLSESQSEIIFKSLKIFLETQNFRKIILINDEQQYGYKIIDYLKRNLDLNKIELKILTRKEFSLGSL